MIKILEISDPMLLSVGICFLIFGIIMFLFPPKKINSLYGYRTASSMESQEKWDFAQKYSAKIMFFIGLGTCTLSLLLPLLGLDEDQNVILGIFILIMILIVLIAIVENRLKKI